MITRRGFFKGIVAAGVLALVPIKIMAERFPWGPWRRMDLLPECGKGVIRFRKYLPSDPRMDVEMILYPRPVVDVVNVNIIFNQDGTEIKS